MLYMHSVVQLTAINKIPILSMQTWAEVSCGYINTMEDLSLCFPKHNQQIVSLARLSQVTKRVC